MDKIFAKYMKWGRKVKSSWTGDTFKLVEDMDESKPTVLAVNESNVQRYDTLRAWLRNWENDESFRKRFTGSIEDCRLEKASYEESLKVSDITPNDIVRFITPQYETMFSVTNLSNVKVDGKIRRVIYVDDYHFMFEAGSAFHICQYAEICKQNGTKVEMI